MPKIYFRLFYDVCLYLACDVYTSEFVYKYFCICTLRTNVCIYGMSFSYFAYVCECVFAILFWLLTALCDRKFH